MGRPASSLAQRRRTAPGWACVVLVLLLGFLPAFGQQPGDTEADVRERLGPPTVSRRQGERVTWVYPDGTRVVFVDGRVIDPRAGAAAGSPSRTVPPPAAEAPPSEAAPSIADAPTPTEAAPEASPQPRTTTVTATTRTSGKKDEPASVATAGPAAREATTNPNRVSVRDSEPTLPGVVAESLPAWRVALLVLGGIISFVCSVILIVRAFCVSILWGLGSLFLPLVGLIFVILHWQVAKVPFLVNLFIATPLMLLAVLA